MKATAALVGINGYASVHFGQLKRLRENGVIDFTAAVILPRERTPENQAYFQEHDCRVYDTLDEMFAKHPISIDLVCLPTGIASHEFLTVEALKHGANVLVEKPAAGSVAAVDHMIEAEKHSGGCFVAIGFQHIYARELRRIKEILLSGKLGTLRRITSMGVWPRDDAYYARNNWAGKLRTQNGDAVFDSPINNAFAHYLNLPLFLAGNKFQQPAHITSVSGELYRARKTLETFDTCAVRFQTREQVEILALFTHTASESIQPTIRLECTGGSVLLDMNRNTWEIFDASGSVVDSGAQMPSQTDMFDDVVRKLSDRSVFCCSLEIARSHTECIEKLHAELPVTILPDSMISRDLENGQLAVTGIIPVFRECFAENKLPSQCGAWLK